MYSFPGNWGWGLSDKASCGYCTAQLTDDRRHKHSCVNEQLHVADSLSTFRPSPAAPFTQICIVLHQKAQQTPYADVHRKNSLDEGSSWV